MGYELDRTVLKEKAKKALSYNRWLCVAVTFVALLLMGVQGSQVRVNINLNNASSFVSSPMVSVNNAAPQSSLLVTLFGIFVANVILVGHGRFYLNNRQQAGKFEDLFSAFRGNYLNVVLVQFLTKLFTSLWALLFIIPGIVKAMSWALVPYLLAENPDLDQKEARDKSAALMQGHKMELLVLYLSFIGWILLGVITMGILLVIYVNPYIEATNAEWAAALMHKEMI